MKKKFSCELSYLLGILTIAAGCALMGKADFGFSMVVAPAYILSRALSGVSDFFTFGTTEYIFQAFLLVIMMIAIRKVKISYLFSFVTAVIYGYTLDGLNLLVNLAVPEATLIIRIVFYILGMVSCSVGVACMIHTYIPAEVYELIVKEVPEKYGWSLTKFKTAYDMVSCAVSIAMSFAFFGMWHFEGVKWGTFVCALVNGFLIGRISKWMQDHLEMTDTLPLRRIFAK